MGRERWKWVVGSAIAVLALAGVVGLQALQLRQVQVGGEDAQQAVDQEALQLKLLARSPSFGFDNVLADWVFLNFLEYYGDDPARRQTGYGLSPAYFEAVTRFDPRFVDVYPFLSGSISYELGQPDLAIALMRRGTQALSPAIDPKAFQVWRFMSLDQLLLLGDSRGAAQSMEAAADWVRGTPYVQFREQFLQTAQFLRRDPNSKPIRVSAWAEIYQRAQAVGDRKTQARAKREVLALGGKLEEKDGQLRVTMPAAPPRSPTPKPTP